MPKFRVNDPESGRALLMEGETPPSEQEIEEAFRSVTQQATSFRDLSAQQPLSLRVPPAPFLPTGRTSTTVGGPPVSVPPGALRSTMAEVGEELTTPTITAPKFKPIEGEPAAVTVGKEAANILIGIPEFMTSKAGVTSLAVAPAAPATVAGLFTADMLYGLGQQVLSSYKNWQRLSPTQKRVVVTDMVGSGLLATLTGAATARAALPKPQIEPAPTIETPIVAQIDAIYMPPRINLGGRLAAIARAKTMLPRAAAQAEREVADAVSERVVQEDRIQEREQIGPRGLPAEAGGGHRAVGGASVEPQVQAGVQPAEVSQAGRQRVLVGNRPAVKTMPDAQGKFDYIKAETVENPDGTVRWETHDEILKRVGLGTAEMDRRVFLNQAGVEKSREQTKQELAAVGEPSKVPGEAHSTDVNRLVTPSLPTKEQGFRSTIQFETYDEPRGEWQSQSRPIVVSKSTIPGSKPWRATVFAGPSDSPVAIGHIELDSPTDIYGKPAVDALSEQLGRYTRNISIAKPIEQAPSVAAAPPTPPVEKPAAVTEPAVAPETSKGDPNIGRTWNSPYGKQTIVRVETFGGRDNYVVATEGTGAERVYSADRIEDVIKRNEHELTPEYVKELAEKRETARLREERDAREREKREKTDAEILEFSKGKSPMLIGRIKKTLLTQVNWTGVVKTRKEAIEAEIEAGAKVERIEGKRQLTKPTGSFFDESATTVAGMDYAEYLENKSKAPKPEAPKAEAARLVQEDASKKVPEVRETLDAHETVPTELAGKPASLGKWLTRTARPSEKAPETQTSRLTTLQSPDNQRVAVVSTYDHPRYGAMLFDPSGGTKHVALTTLLKQGWKPIASTLTREPHSRFRKVFGSMEAYQSEIGQPLAEARAALKTYPAPTQVTEPVVPAAAETVTDPIVAHLAQHPTLNAAIAAIQTAPNRRQIQAAIRSAMDDLQQKNPKLTDEQAAEQVLTTFYEESRKAKPGPEAVVEPGTAPEIAPTTPSEPTPSPKGPEPIRTEKELTESQKVQQYAAGMVQSAATYIKRSIDAGATPREAGLEWAKEIGSGLMDTPDEVYLKERGGLYTSTYVKGIFGTTEGVALSAKDYLRAVDSARSRAIERWKPKSLTGKAPKAAIAEPAPESPHGVRLDVTTPAEHPLGPIDTGTTPTLSLWQNLSGELKEAAAGLRAFWRAFAMQALPKISAENRVAGEAGVRYDASRRIARTKGIEFAGKVTEGVADRTFDKKFGTALEEDNLRSIREGFRQAGDAEAAARVNTLIGVRNSPFQTEAQYQAFLNNPQTQRVIQKHKQLWDEQKDPIYRKANDLDPDLELETRGLQTGARINLKAVLPGDTTRTAIGGTGRPSLIRQAVTRLRRDPFARQAKGTGQVYEGSYQEIMASGFEREYPIAAQHEFIKQLVDSGLAKVTQQEFPKDLTVRGERPKAYELKIRPWRNYWIQVPRSLAPEFENVMGLTPSWQVPGVRHLSDFLTSASVQGFAEGSTHVANLSTGILTGLGPTANPMLNALIKSVGRADILYQLPRILIRGFAKNQSEMLRLAEIGAAKEPYTGLLGWFINRIDRGVRLVSADTYREMAAKGWVEDTETGLREYVNQVGQYSKRLQPAVIARLRETGIQPFATAAHTFNVMGLRTLGFGPAAKSPTWYGALALRADKAGGLMGFIVLTAALNKLLSGNASGPPGTQLGNVGWRDDQGKVKQFPLARLFGYERGPRITGLQSYVEARRLGLPEATALGSGVRAIGGTALSYVSGPMVQFATKAITGKRPGVPMVQEAKVVPPPSEDELQPFKTQAAANIAAALQQANPAIDSSLMVIQGKELPEILRRQFSRYTPRPGMSEATIEAMPKIVRSKQMFDYASALAKEARKQPRSERNDFINKRLEEDDVTGKDRAEAMRLLKLKGVFRYE